LSLQPERTGRTLAFHTDRCHVTFGKDGHTARELANYTIFEGTSEIQRLIIARAISGLHIN
jgi:alkylation response protein AidB-like acyl-CoA dehydrogenase